MRASNFILTTTTQGLFQSWMGVANGFDGAPDGFGRAASGVSWLQRGGARFLDLQDLVLSRWAVVEEDREPLFQEVCHRLPFVETY